MGRRQARRAGAGDHGARDRRLYGARLHPRHGAHDVRLPDRRGAAQRGARGGVQHRSHAGRLCGVRQGTEGAAALGAIWILIVESTIASLMHGFAVALQPANLWYAFLGCLVGTLVGVLPGIGPLAGISILLPITFGLNATNAIVMLAGIYYGSQYGGSTTSILLRIPGEASSVMTCIDGNAMARKGRAGAALCIAAVGSW